MHAKRRGEMRLPDSGIVAQGLVGHHREEPSVFVWF